MFHCYSLYLVDKTSLQIYHIKRISVFMIILDFFMAKLPSHPYTRAGRGYVIILYNQILHCSVLV